MGKKLAAAGAGLVTVLLALVIGVPLLLISALLGAAQSAAGCAPSGGQLGSSQITDAEAKLGLTLPYSQEYVPNWGAKITVTPGHVPVLSVNTVGTSWAAIASGGQDAVIRRQAAEVAALPGPVYVALHHEPENDPHAGTPTSYVAAWRHYVAAFRAAGVANVRWTWIMMADSFNNGGAKAAAFYPGDDVIDVVAADGYNWQGVRPGAGRSFAEVFAGFHAFTAAHAKPGIVAEMGMSAQPGRAAWITAAAATARSWALLAALWYDARDFTIGPDAVPALSAWAGAPASVAAATTLTPLQVAQAAQAGGIPDEQLVTATAVALAESGGRPAATHVNNDGSTDYGLWQINSVHAALLAGQDRRDPTQNAALAAAVYTAAGDSWAPWVTYSLGVYRQSLPAAQAAVTQLAGGTPAGSGTCPAGAAGPGGGPIRQAAVAFALAQLGKPYRWGAAGPDAYDCSGLVMAAYAAAGVTLPRTAGEQWHATTPVQPGSETTGDLLFTEITGTDAGHVMMVVSVTGGTMTLVEAPHTDDVVKTITLPDTGAVLGRVAAQ